MSSDFETRTVTHPFRMGPYRTLNTFLTEAAERWPDRSALIEAETMLTWAALEQTSARIASALLRSGVRPGDRVGLCAPKSARIIAAMHGVLKAGCVCVPVDPASPAVRIKAVLEGCAPAAVIGAAETLAKLEISSSPVRISINQGVEGAMSWQDVMAGAVVPMTAQLQLSDLAYLLYTSGSTGQPKGVMLSHENVSAFATWAAVEFRVGPEDRVASVAPLHFDLSTFDLYSTAWSGASLCVPPAMYLSFPVRLTEWLAAQRISIMYAVPSLLAMIAERGDVKTKNLDALRLLLFAGEVCPPRLLSALLDLLPGVEFANLYGPTETNVCTFERIDRDQWDRVSPISIGVPCDGTRVLLIDDTGVPVAGNGIAGELLVSGPTVALGYWRDSAKSAARFIVGDGARWCRTGDYAEFDDASRLMFRGRRDHMVKIRGYRVELGEVESALLAHPALAETAVVSVDEVLVAFVRASGAVPSSEEIREHCAGRLPSYMVPAEVRIVATLPHGSTGKIDRLALQRIAKHG
jgi:amino acid adenylation domain-containing protein